VKKYIFRIQVLLACLVLLLTFRAGGEIQRGVKPPQEGLKGKSEIILKRINAFCTANGFKIWDVNTENVQELVYKGTDLEGDLFWIRGKDFSMKFEPSSGNLVECGNSKLETELTMIDNKTFREFDEPQEQRWTSEKATDIASNFALEVLGRLSESFGPAKYEFDRYSTYSQKTKTKRYRVPYWRVQFPRIDSKGYEFQMEYLEIQIYENAGPISLFVKMSSRYEQEEGEPLNQEQVMKIALDYAQELRKRGPVAGMFRGGQIIVKPASAKLEIVKPNHLADLSELPTSKVIDLNARLAWVIWFEWSKNDPSDARKKGGIGVWIDAHTGKPLGGDAF